MKTLKRKKALEDRLAAASAPSPRICQGCGTKERVDALGYTNFMPSLPVCVLCAFNAMKGAK